MHTSRLLQTADLLDYVEPEKFNINTWHCGLAACAVGHAALHQPFNNQGLTLSGHWYPRPLFKMEDIVYHGWDAAEKFYDLRDFEAKELFSSTRYPGGVTPKDVASRIRDFVLGRTPAQWQKTGNGLLTHPPVEC